MPNAKVLETKKEIVAQLADDLQSAASGVIVDYKGITVDADTKLRRDLRNAGVEYSVIKNSMLRFAINKVGYGELDGELHGTTALAISRTDPVAPARILSQFAAKNEKFFRIKGGFVDGKVVGQADVKVLAELPSREVLISRVLAGFNAPISGLANVLNGTIRGLVVALNAIAEKKAQ